MSGCVVRRLGVEHSLDELERGAALPVLPGLELGWLGPVRAGLEQVERVWSRQCELEGDELRALAGGLARREDGVLGDLRGLRREVEGGATVSEQLRLRVLACLASARQLLEGLRRLALQGRAGSDGSPTSVTSPRRRSPKAPGRARGGARLGSPGCS